MLGLDLRAVLAACSLAIAACALAPAVSEASLLPPPSACNGQSNTGAAESQQEDAMRCLINHMRDNAGLGGLQANNSLERAAGRKVRDVFDCGFSHTACGNPADQWAKKFGYTSQTSSWQWGENLAWGAGKRGSARNVLQAWLNSPPHRATMMRGSFDDLGLGLRRGGFSGQGDAAVWVLQVGCRGC